MRKLFYLLLFSVIIVTSCSKDSCDEAIYYVKYEVEIIDGIPHNLIVHTTGEDGQQNITTGTYSYSEIIGPVKKGFECRISASCREALTMFCKIYVSRNNEPFALKAVKNGTGDSLAYYTISY